MSDHLDSAHRHAREWLDSLAGRRVHPGEVEVPLEATLPAGPQDPAAVVDALAAELGPGLVATPGPRYFGFVTGGSLPAALAADWLVSAWDQNGGMQVMSPAAAEAERVAGAWLIDLLGLPAGCGVGFVTGGLGATFTCLAAARHAVLEGAGWDVEAKGLQGAPAVRVVAGDQVHISAISALRLLGFGADRVERVGVDNQGRMLPVELARVLGEGPGGPLIVLAQAGEVNTGAFDPIGEVAEIAHGAGGWVHVDGAFGLWAAASPSRRHLLQRHDSADSWAVDGHKWLNVPYDSGYAFVADADAQRAAMSATAAYLVSREGERNGFDWVPESSRRARAIPTLAALRSLGRSGVADLVDACCDHATRMAAHLREIPGVEILNEVVLNQVLVRVGDDDDTTARAIAAVQADGTCWLGGTSFRGRGAMRISFSGHATSERDVDRAAEAIAAACRSATL